MHNTLEITKEQELLEWCREKKLFSYVDVISWKESGYYIRAERTIRDFVSQGYLRRLPHQESILRGLIKKGRAALAWFEII